MACDRFTGAIRAHALGAPLNAQAAAHLAVCSACQTTFETDERVLATIDVALAEVMTTAPAPGFVSHLRAHVEAAPARWTPAVWWMPATAAALVLLLSAVIVTFVARDRSSGRDASTAHPTGATPSAQADRGTARPAVAAAAAPKTQPRVVRRTMTGTSRTARSPEVLVPGQEREAVGRLFASLRAGRPEVVSMLLSLRGGEPVGDEHGVTIEPLRIDPVVVSAMPGSVPIFDR